MKICENGHIEHSNPLDFELGANNHCPDCGAAFHEQCPSCRDPFNNPLSGPKNWTEGTLPNNCTECGADFPWAESSSASSDDAKTVNNYNFGSVENWQSGFNNTQEIHNSFNDVKREARTYPDPEVLQRVQQIENEVTSENPREQNIETNIEWLKARAMPIAKMVLKVLPGTGLM